jgi:predicted NBD/HSP70 family sugar kinase
MPYKADFSSLAPFSLQNAPDVSLKTVINGSLNLPSRDDLVLRVAGGSPVERVYGKRNIRRAHVLALLRSGGALSRTDIARRLGYNAATVTTIVDQLVSSGLVSEDFERRPGMGRPPTLVSLDGTAASVIGLDLGRTSVSAMLTDLNGNILGKASGEAGLPEEPEACGLMARKLVAEAVSVAPLPIPPVAGVAAVLPGIFWTEEDGIRRLVPRAAAVELALQQAVGVPPVIDGDSLAVSFAELWFSGRPNLDSFVSINVSEGLGSVLFTHGQYLAGAHGCAGDLGHVQLGDPDVACFCGASACLENVASGSGMRRLAKKAGLIGPRSRADADFIAGLARQGNSDAKAIVGRFAQALGRGIASVVQYTDPGVVVIGGSLSRHADLYLSEVGDEARRNLPRHQRGFQLIVSTLNEDAVCRGACAVLLNRIFGASHLSVETIV